MLKPKSINLPYNTITEWKGFDSYLRELLFEIERAYDNVYVYSYERAIEADRTLPQTPRDLVDDFLPQSVESGEIGRMGWALLNGTAVLAGNEQNHPGVMLLRCTTVNGQVTALCLGGTPTTTLFRYDEFDTMYWVIGLPEIDGDFVVRAGLLSDLSADPPDDGIYIERLDTDTSFYGVSRASASQTRSSALLGHDTSFHTFRLRRIDESNVGFKVDNKFEQVVTTNLIAPDINLNVGCQVIPKAPATTRDLKIDFFSLKLLKVDR